MNLDYNYKERFDSRHIGPNQDEIDEMLEFIRADSISNLIQETIPESIQLKDPLNLPEAVSEFDFIRDFKMKISANKINKSFIGLGYYDCVVPPVIQRNILENPGWYTAYTPYQAEIAQGRLEALVNFQTMVMDLTGMEIANASLLDEGTAAAEAMGMFFSLRKGAKKSAIKFLVDENAFPQTINVLRTRSKPIGIDLIIGNIQELDLADPEVFGILIQYPDGNGSINNPAEVIRKAKEYELFTSFSCDLLALTLLTPPGEMGADVVIGTTQRFGVPMGFGGPHAAYFATLEEYKRFIPGRIIGASQDSLGNHGYRMALQTREQHIKRERATSNICTAQVLLAVMSGMYGVYHGPDGLKKIALKIHGLAKLLAKNLTELGFEIQNNQYFDTIKFDCEIEQQLDIKKKAQKASLNFRYYESGAIGISLDETTSVKDIEVILGCFGEKPLNENIDKKLNWDQDVIRSSDYMTHPVFHKYRSEHEMLRYLKRLENKDLSLVHSMISLGSCTMKLNATTEMIPVTWAEVGNMHPYAPEDQIEGYKAIFQNLESWLGTITGLPGVSLQPNSGAQGEYAGLMVIKAYHESNNQANRNVTLIPSSAHGTNPASAVMAGTSVIIVKCDVRGNIDLEDLKEKAEVNKEHLAALMVTYPSTHGVFETGIQEICKIIHDNGGQVYMDGANMNAQVGLTSPAVIGADVCHLNLHKTFCIPHGGGGPGMGPIAVANHLIPFLPGDPTKTSNPISAANWGSASILTISYAYIAMMGVNGLKKATEVAILNANYMKERLKDYYSILYSGDKEGRVAHEFIVDCRSFKSIGVEVEDIAKRLMDYGYHAPTISFPVPGTMMIEPTESESKEELDRFCEALISIRNEIDEVEQGLYDDNNNVLKNSPHTQNMIVTDSWEYPYSREKAAFPLAYLKQNKFWPSIGRIDNAYGDRNLFCACIPIDNYEDELISEN